MDVDFLLEMRAHVKKNVIGQGKSSVKFGIFTVLPTLRGIIN